MKPSYTVASARALQSTTVTTSYPLWVWHRRDAKPHMPVWVFCGTFISPTHCYMAVLKGSPWPAVSVLLPPGLLWKYTYPFLLKDKSNTSALCEEAMKRWWLLSVSKLASFENPANINHMLEQYLPFLRAWCLTASYTSWQKNTSQGKQRLCKPNIPMDH